MSPGIGSYVMGGKQGSIDIKIQVFRGNFEFADPKKGSSKIRDRKSLSGKGPSLAGRT